jgi:hypothetical protein
MSDKMPTEQMTRLMEGATGLHELFLTMVKAGFTERQALTILGEMMSRSAG